MKLSSLIVILLLIPQWILASTYYQAYCSNGSLPVHNIDTGLDYATIQEAISAPETLAGHVIFVDAGTYTECVGVSKSVSLVGESQSSTIIRSRAYQTQFGTVLSIQADNVTIDSLTVRDGSLGIAIGANYAVIVNCRILNNVDGISSDYSFGGNIITRNKVMNSRVFGINMHTSNNVISENVVADNYLGINLQGSVPEPTCGNIVDQNNVTRNYIGCCLYESYNNTFRNNVIGNNDIGCQPYFSNNNAFIHNNFLSNAVHAASPNSTNKWDDGYPSGGNYWDNYNGTDTNQDGIGDAPYTIDENNQDNNPLMGMFSDFTIPYQEESYHVATISNSTISNFNYSNNIVTFNVTGEESTIGFCAIRLPKALIEAPYTILVDNYPPTMTKEWSNSNETHVSLYFVYNFSQQDNHQVTVIPEFPSLTLVLMLMTLTATTIVFTKKKSNM